MTKSVPVRCPSCRRERRYLPPRYPCACGAAVTLSLPRESSPVSVRHRTWAASWTELTCHACGRVGHWPQAEFDCSCGVTVRLAAGAAETDPARATAGERGPFRPLTIRTAHDAVACAAQFLRWLGFADVRAAAPRPRAGVDLRGPAVVGLVNAATEPTVAEDVETLWLHSLVEPTTAVAFSLAGFDRGARAKADALRLPLFVLDLTGTPQPVNDAADALVRRGTREA
ncbi:hypothetical protein CAG99_03260 [Streptomyces marincola]|uniref:Restriction endonuclease n=1 Tax=Streptomyces marincola TaxID=2878388 RepID=A0A1W7CTC4_9ACTN|nr:hypothetical protein [Streptomyces marincola]ARQ67982.1 hypothetical protein CAG99_03260 [Streptomyces marincola]